ncbi:MAG: NAD(P)H-hydrate dehydratase [Actinobacteria bacterium]|nr:NAD(P)H-hydrate dehydratase [Actinomycetota bacterium]
MAAAVRSGLDLVEVEHLRAALERHPRLRERVFTPAELAYCEGKADPVVSLAARFAAKEAVGKLLGSGVLTWLEIEVTPERSVRLSGRTAALAASLGVADIALSLTHTGSLAAASAVAVVVTGVGAGAAAEAPTCSALVGHASLQERPFGFTAAQIRELDRVAIEEMGVPGVALMERAALGVSELVLARYPRRHTLVVCGHGNNGGDGLAAARQLHLAGHPVACVVAGPEAELGTDCALQLAAARKAGVNLRVGGVPDYLWEETELVLDCLLGTGARAELREPAAGWAARINAAADRGVPVVAVDVPTGVDASTGEVAAGAVAADCTVTFHAAKTGIVAPPGSEAAGEVLVWDIGLPRFREPGPDVRVVTAADVEVPGRRPDDHKYRAGLVAVLAGSRDYPGAALLAAGAAARCGAGYVRLLTARGAADVLRERLVEVVVREVGEGDHIDHPKGVLEALADDRTDSVVVGPGLGRHPGTMEVVRRVVAEDGCPMVLDADGILAFAGDAGSLAVGRDLVLTPHAGELAALLGVPVVEVTRSALVAARRAAVVTGQVVVLKGSSTVVVGKDGTTWVVTQGPPQLASAGTGDVLSGCIGALLAVGMGPLEAAFAGVWLHAEAGRRGALVYKAGLLAQDLMELLPVVLAERVFDRRPGWTV